MALGQVAVQKGDAAFVAVLSALLAANIFDVTLFSGQILYPLAAVAGWRAAAYRDTRAGERDSGMRQLGVRVALLLTDFVMVLLAFSLAIWLRQWSTGWFGLTPINPQATPLELTRYALLLWPVMAWREGLYPGYGLTEPQELRKQMVSAAYAGLILAVGTVLFNREFDHPALDFAFNHLVEYGANPARARRDETAVTPFTAVGARSRHFRRGAGWGAGRAGAHQKSVRWAAPGRFFSMTTRSNRVRSSKV